MWCYSCQKCCFQVWSVVHCTIKNTDKNLAVHFYPKVNAFCIKKGKKTALRSILVNLHYVWWVNSNNWIELRKHCNEHAPLFLAALWLWCLTCSELWQPAFCHSWCLLLSAVDCCGFSSSIAADIEYSLPFCCPAQSEEFVGAEDADTRNSETC